MMSLTNIYIMYEKMSHRNKSAIEYLEVNNGTSQLRGV